MQTDDKSSAVDVLIVGAGAAGLATTIFTGRRMSGRRIVALDGARTLGAKILVSGGGRCNVTNTAVTPGDFWGGNSHIVKRVLAALPVERTVAFFREIGVEMHEEEHGKLFPDTNRARTVLEALLREARRVNVEVLSDHRVSDIERTAAGFRVVVSRDREFLARCVVLATGGLSLPKSGSDGFGYQLARKLGHSLVPTTPGLAPLLLEGDFHASLSGVSQEVEISVLVDGAKPTRLRGSLLWTHFGISGPVALNASRHWHRAKLSGHSPRISTNLLSGDDFAAAEARFIRAAAEQPRAHVRNVLATLFPARVADAILADAILAEAGVTADTPMAHLSRVARRALIRRLIEFPLPIRDSRGYAHAEVTAGGVPLEEIDPATMESRICRGLFLVGEILDIDGRIGGFNFQWAWSSGFAASAGLVQRLG